MTLFVLAATFWVSIWGTLLLSFRERFCFHFGSVSASILGALQLPCWYHYILGDLAWTFLLIPLSKFLAGIFSRKRWWWPIPQVMNQVFLHGSMVLKGFAGSSPCFVSLVCSFQIWCPKTAKISYRIQSYDSIWMHTWFWFKIGFGIYWWCRNEENRFLSKRDL